MQLILHADLYLELLRLSQHGLNPATLHLGSPVSIVDSAEGKVELQPGEVYMADIIIAADSSHYICR